MDEGPKAPRHGPEEARIVVDIPVDKPGFSKEVFPEAAGKIIEYRYFVSPVKKFPDDMTPDITRAADYEDIQE
jgi:hypothetical protein